MKNQLTKNEKTNTILDTYRSGSVPPTVSLCLATVRTYIRKGIRSFFHPEISEINVDVVINKCYSSSYMSLKIKNSKEVNGRLKTDYSEQKLHQDKKCGYCLAPFNTGSIRHKKYCSTRCNQDAYIMRKTGKKVLRKADIDSIADKLCSKQLLTEHTLPQSLTTNRNSQINARLCLLTSILFLLFPIIPAYAETVTPQYFNQIVDQIYKVENSQKYPYGIKSIPTYGNKELARKYCYNTVKNNYERWIKAGKPGDYLDFLADRFCPKSCDPIGNKNWKANIHSLMKRR